MILRVSLSLLSLSPFFFFLDDDSSLMLLFSSLFLSFRFTHFLANETRTMVRARVHTHRERVRRDVPGSTTALGQSIPLLSLTPVSRLSLLMQNVSLIGEW